MRSSRAKSASEYIRYPLAARAVGGSKLRSEYKRSLRTETPLNFESSPIVWMWSVMRSLSGLHQVASQLAPCRFGWLPGLFPARGGADQVGVRYMCQNDKQRRGGKRAQ